MNIDNPVFSFIYSPVGVNGDPTCFDCKWYVKEKSKMMCSHPKAVQIYDLENDPHIKDYKSRNPDWKISALASLIRIPTRCGPGADWKECT